MQESRGCDFRCGGSRFEVGWCHNWALGWSRGLAHSCCDAVAHVQQACISHADVVLARATGMERGQRFGCGIGGARARCLLCRIGRRCKWVGLGLHPWQSRWAFSFTSYLVGILSSWCSRCVWNEPRGRLAHTHSLWHTHSHLRLGPRHRCPGECGGHFWQHLVGVGPRRVGADVARCLACRGAGHDARQALLRHVEVHALGVAVRILACYRAHAGPCGKVQNTSSDYHCSSQRIIFGGTRRSKDLDQVGNTYCTGGEGRTPF
mmetsp:Transcript_138596/g.360215  ORF Transcript_138596/g.360215 Transcript_138596/m.360215 type:complete len:263 (+) Transcript_138596:434-1222(+)